jgi:mitochondrial fission protein ELM1
MQIWGITGGRRGNDVLVEGVANALPAYLPDHLPADSAPNFRLIHTDLRAPWRWLTPYRPALVGAKQDARMRPPWPDLVLASGRRAVAHARYIRAASHGHSFTAFLQNPHISAKHFDFVWAPSHDGVRDTRIMQTLLSPHGLSTQSLHSQAAQWRDKLIPAAAQKAERTIVTVSIGGPSNAYEFDMASFTKLAQHLQNLAAQGCFLLITLSRRSPDTYERVLRQHIAPKDGYIWDNQGDNPYHAMLGLAAHLIVTADSSNMVGEACLAGKPVQVFDLPGGTAKFARFHAQLRAKDYVRPFTGTLQSWPVEPRNATPEIAAEIARRLAAHRDTMGQ